MRRSSSSGVYAECQRDGVSRLILDIAGAIGGPSRIIYLAPRDPPSAVECLVSRVEGHIGCRELSMRS